MGHFKPNFLLDFPHPSWSSSSQHWIIHDPWFMAHKLSIPNKKKDPLPPISLLPPLQRNHP